MLLLAADLVPNVVDSTSKVAQGIDTHGMSFLLALSLVGNGVQWLWAMRQGVVRERNIRSEMREFLAVSAKLNSAVDMLDRLGLELKGRLERLLELVLERLPAKRPPGGGRGAPPVLGPEPPSTPGKGVP